MFISFLFMVIFFRKEMDKIRFLIFPLIISSVSLYAIWTFSVSEGIMDSGRLLTFEGLSPEFNKRLSMLIEGTKLVFDFSNKTIDGKIAGFHSLFASAGTRYGFSFFILICIPFIYLIIKSYKTAIYNLDSDIRLISYAILTTAIVAVIQAVFGITLFSAKYAQVFWILVGYIALVDRTNRQHRNL